MSYVAEMTETIMTGCCGSLLYTYGQYQGNQMTFLEGWNQYSLSKPAFGASVVAYLPAKSRYVFAILYQDAEGSEFWLDNRGITHAVNSCDIWIDYPLKGEV